jgi:hypothetical protein
MTRKRTVSILIAIDIAGQQQCDVLSATGCKKLPDWGIDDHSIVLLERDTARGTEYRVTTHTGHDAEFGQGHYFGDLNQAYREYDRQVTEARNREREYELDGRTA